MEDFISKCFTLLKRFRPKTAKVLIVLAAIAGGLLYFSHTLGTVSGSREPKKVFEINPGDGFRRIVDRLESEGLIRSSMSFKILSLVTGSASKLKPGSYRLSPFMTSYEILNELIIGSRREITAMIPEGANVYEIDKILNERGVSKKGNIISAVLEKNLEGRLFPDTYKFFTGSDADEIINKFLENFKLKTKGLSGGDIRNEDLVLASLLEKEVPSPEDQKIVAGILKKRLSAGIPLQVDATICYIKMAASPDKATNCYPLSPLDFKIASPYNTYLNRGLPSGPIGNPGSSAIEAAMSPKASQYLFYLSDPKTRQTHFAETLEEQTINKNRYLQK